ncbi:MAG: DUF4435 domain-containing protein [Chitinophagales bacterium]
MSSKTDKRIAAFRKFKLAIQKTPEHLFCFFEGSDEMYYAERIQMFTEKYKVIPCGGRVRLLKVYQLIRENEEYGKYKTAFFIDRDFNAKMPVQQPPIFETEAYSIENLYVTQKTFGHILEFFFQISSQKETTKDTFETYMELYKQRQKEFHEASLLLNAWYACVIEHGIQTGNRQPSVLQERSIFKRKDGSDGGKNYLNFIHFSLQKIKKDYDIAKIKSTFPSILTIEEEILEQKIAEFSQAEHYKIFRGKFELQFLVRFIKQMLEDDMQILHHSPIGDARYLKNENALRLFSKYAETPKHLLEYLKQVTQTPKAI